MALLLGGCALNRALSPDTYTVRRGDTLFSIAQQYGLDWHDLADWNRISPPYRIDVGEQLSLEPYPPLDYNHMPARGAAGSQRVVRAPQDTPAEQQRSIQAATPQLTRTFETSGGPPQTSGAGKRAKTEPAPANESADDEAGDHADDARIQAASQSQARAPVHVGGPSEDGWQWPVSGSIVRGYDPQKGRQGIEIGGRLGTPVYAASSGKVVYNGSGLKGYGKLIIIKHDSHYLSAYGFNRRTRVKQGQNVAAGAHIADMGLGPENKPMLHFEIRHDGSPIAPGSVLPKH